IYIEDAAHGLIPTEVRMRKRYLDAWAINAYRPFPTAASLAAAIELKRPNWASSTNLSAFVAHLGSNATLQASTVRSPAFADPVVLSGSLDMLPALGDDALIRDLLATTPFVSAYGLSWK